MNSVNVQSLNRDQGVNVTSKYKVIKTGELVEAFQSQGYVVDSLKVQKSRKLELTGSGLHEIRLSHPNLTLANGLRPQIIMLNSYNGTAAYRLLMGVFRLVCSNGLVVGTTYESFKVKHIGNDTLPKVFAAIERVSQQTKFLMANIEEMQSTLLNAHQAIEFARNVAQVLVPETKLEGSVNAEDLLHIKRAEDSAHDLFSVMNVIQENALRGGLRFQTMGPGIEWNVRNNSTRAIQSIDRAIKINQLVWDTAQKYLKAA